MKIIKEHFFVEKGIFYESSEFKVILQEIRAAVESVTWFNEDKFIIYPEKKANGVLPIRLKFVQSLVLNGWIPEKRMSFAKGMKPGPVDVVKNTEYGDFAVEWETGNISSSHRALNKIAVGIIQNAIIGGILIIPIRNLAKYLTDRIGNYEEIEPYFPMYQNLKHLDGFMGIISVDYDDVSYDAPKIPKGKDGNAIK